MKKRLIILGALLVVLTAPALAQNWDETTDGGGDAGIHNAAQMTTGGGTITTISGTLDQAGGDHTDCYTITVQAVASFYATSDPAIDANAVAGEPDTRMWIWDSGGSLIISGNDDTPAAAGLLSVVADPTSGPITYTATPTNPVVTPLVDGSQYTVCVSYFANDPEDGANVDLINLGTFEALNGPDPAAGAFVAYEDTDTVSSGAYTLAFSSAQAADVPVELLAFGVE